MRPLSALYYIRSNKGRSLIIIFMLMLTVFMFMPGNYIESLSWYWTRCIEYDNKSPMISALTTDEDFADYGAVLEDLKADEELTIIEHSAFGYSGLDWICTLGFEMGSCYYQVNTAEDLQVLFDRFGIESDLSGVHDGSVVMSSMLARNNGLELGDTVDQDVDSSIHGSYTLDALIEDDSFILFYVDDRRADNNEYRAYIMSENMSGRELRDHISGIIGDRKVKLDDMKEEQIKKDIYVIDLIYIVAIILTAATLSVTVNSVVTGQFIKRTYEFAVYRAIGKKRREIYRKIFCEIMVMDIIAIVAGAGLIFLLEFLLNELLYLPKGQYLPYFSGLGLAGFLIANLLVVIPTVILKGRRMSRADITEF